MIGRISIKIIGSVKRLKKNSHPLFLSSDFSDSPGQDIKLCLWGQQAGWVSGMQAGIRQVWEMLYVIAKYDNDSSSVVLHSTPKSSKRKLAKDDPNSSKILTRFAEHGVGKTCKFQSILELFEAKYSGNAEIEACVSSLSFQISNSSLVISGEQDVKHLRVDPQKLVYTGCGTCLRPLNQDKNHVYAQCSFCVANNPQYESTISHCYKPFTVCLRDAKGTVSIEVMHDGALRLFQGFPARQLAMQSREENLQNEFFRSVHDLLVSEKPRTFTLLCHTALDENGFVEHRHFSLRNC